MLPLASVMAEVVNAGTPPMMMLSTRENDGNPLAAIVMRSPPAPVSGLNEMLEVVAGDVGAGVGSGTRNGVDIGPKVGVGTDGIGVATTIALPATGAAVSAGGGTGAAVDVGLGVGVGLVMGAGAGEIAAAGEFASSSPEGSTATHPSEPKTIIPANTIAPISMRASLLVGLSPSIRRP